MRTIDTHKTNEANSKLTITVSDEPGPGGANHAFVIMGMDYGQNPSLDAILHQPQGLGDRCALLFQNGAIKEVGVNGVTHEALLAVLIDRLDSFQAGPYACSENANAVKHLRLARAFLNERTERRTVQGVEGTMAKDPRAQVEDPHNG